MAVPADGRLFSLPAAGRLRGTAGLGGRNLRLVKFADGELMGNKLKLPQPHCQGAHSKQVKGLQVCMSLTANIAGESRVR
uniref:Glucose-1-phosphate adenylyltransferase n=1 Tax=Rhizophora mucronata TaxID=61149 RepID=A0A2P2LH47_RHIMU